ncbi:hypothetical protein M3Y94_00795300 [Aphelenchoides besseyi]|nr:hypothetical protein M3Y94_00795300 [Aphelenchoides besseyi]
MVFIELSDDRFTERQAGAFVGINRDYVVFEDTRVEQLMEKIAERLNCEADTIELEYQGETLIPASTLEDYGITETSTILLTQFELQNSDSHSETSTDSVSDREEKEFREKFRTLANEPKIRQKRNGDWVAKWKSRPPPAIRSPAAQDFCILTVKNYSVRCRCCLQWHRNNTNCTEHENSSINLNFEFLCSLCHHRCDSAVNRNRHEAQRHNFHRVSKADRRSKKKKLVITEKDIVKLNLVSDELHSHRIANSDWLPEFRRQHPNTPIAAVGPFYILNDDGKVIPVHVDQPELEPETDITTEDFLADEPHYPFNEEMNTEDPESQEVEMNEERRRTPLSTPVPSTPSDAESPWDPSNQDNQSEAVVSVSTPNRFANVRERIRKIRDRIYGQPSQEQNVIQSASGVRSENANTEPFEPTDSHSSHQISRSQHIMSAPRNNSKTVEVVTIDSSSSDCHVGSAEKVPRGELKFETKTEAQPTIWSALRQPTNTVYFDLASFANFESLPYSLYVGNPEKLVLFVVNNQEKLVVPASVSDCSFRLAGFEMLPQPKRLHIFIKESAGLSAINVSNSLSAGNWPLNTMAFF